MLRPGVSGTFTASFPGELRLRSFRAALERGVQPAVLILHPARPGEGLVRSLENSSPPGASD